MPFDAREYYQENRESRLAYQRSYQEEHQTAIKAYQRWYYQQRKQNMVDSNGQRRKKEDLVELKLVYDAAAKNIKRKSRTALRKWTVA